MTSSLRASYSESLTTRVIVQSARINPDVWTRMTLYDRICLTNMFQNLLLMGTMDIETERWTEHKWEIRL